jgi:L-asparagine oxygenase
MREIRGLKDRLAAHGYVLLRNHRPSADTAQVAETIGEVCHISGLAPIQQIRPRAEWAAPKNIYSGNFGLGEFPLHTDLAHWFNPPRYFVLRCVVGSATVATRLLKGEDIVNAVGRISLERALVQPRKPLLGRRSLLRMLERRSATTERIRWDELFVAAATRASGDTVLAVKAYLRSAATTDVVLDSPGDTLLIDNWRMLHGRSSVPLDATDRHVDRAYLSRIK